MPMNPRLLVPRATFDPDAAAYLRAVEAADGQALETPVKRAVDDFFRGTKADGIWDAIKASPAFFAVLARSLGRWCRLRVRHQPTTTLLTQTTTVRRG
jgi:hypothetical protein